MKAMRNPLDTPRIGFVVSTKVAKRAVVRNLVKRRMREIVRKALPRLIGGVDIAFMARSESVGMTYAELERSMTDLMARAGLFKRP
jgi:ribonuclease P protein component